jgi:hypothetical protein
MPEKLKLYLDQMFNVVKRSRSGIPGEIPPYNALING